MKRTTSIQHNNDTSSVHNTLNKSSEYSSFEPLSWLKPAADPEERPHISVLFFNVVVTEADELGSPKTKLAFMKTDSPDAILREIEKQLDSPHRDKRNKEMKETPASLRVNTEDVCTASEVTASLESLPREIGVYMLSWLSIADIHNLRFLSKALFDLTDYDLVWKRMYEEKWGHPVHPLGVVPPFSVPKRSLASAEVKDEGSCWVPRRIEASLGNSTTTLPRGI